MLKLSICLITYNHERFIAETLDSILTQEVNFDYEIVIGEDRSKDNTKAIIESYMKRYPGRIRLNSHEKNLGSTLNFKMTLLACKGEYISMLDGDDLMCPGKLQKQVDYLENNPDCVMVAHDMQEFDDTTKKHTRLIKPSKIKNRYMLKDLLVHGSIFGNSSKMFRRSALQEDCVDEKINIIADMYLTIQVLGEGTIGYIPETLGMYRKHPESLMRNLKGKEVYEDEHLTLNAVTRKFGSKYEKYYSGRISYANLIYGMDALHKNNPTLARERLLKSIQAKWNLAKSQYVYLILSVLPDWLRSKIFSFKKNII